MEFYNRVISACIFWVLVLNNISAQNNTQYVKDIEYIYPHEKNLDSHDILYRDEEAILSLFQKYKEKEPMRVQELFEAYKECFNGKNLTVPSTARYPFIVIEGNNRLVRKKVARILAKKMGGYFLSNPPPCMGHLMDLFPRKTQARNAFFFLSTYAAAHVVKAYLLLGVPVIMNGYYYEQAAHVINRIYRKTVDIPDMDSVLYVTPKNLLKPDMLVYLCSNTNTAAEYMAYSYSHKNPLIYHRFRDVPVEVIQAEEMIGRTVGHIYEALRNRIGMSFFFNSPVPNSYNPQ